MWSLSRPQRALAPAIAVIACLVLLPGASSAEPGPIPGLPLIPKSALEGGLDQDSRNTYAWSNVTQVGRAGSIPAKQWTRVPVGIAATNIDLATRNSYDEQGQVVSTQADYDIHAFLVPSSADEPYGRSPVITVRTVAFGSIPVELSLQLRQRRDADDLPVSLRLLPSYTTDFIRAEDHFPSTSLEDLVEIAVTRVVVDGVRVPVGASCSTGPTAHLKVASTPIVIHFGAGEKFNQDVGFSGVEGGTLNGTLDIPAFSGCTTGTGDDLSPLLTSAASSTGNPVTIKIGILGCYSGFDEAGIPQPAKPGTRPQEAGCPPDQSPTVEGVPSPLTFPDHAPGDPDD